MNTILSKLVKTVLLAAAVLCLPGVGDACTRVMYKGPDQMILTARSMDFSMEIPANLWSFPAGIERSGETGQNTIHWTSKYGSVAVSSWDIAVSDGMNEKGLNANMLWLNDTKYAPFSEDTGKPGLSVALWAQYVLDNFATVNEVVDALSKEEFVVVSDYVPGTDKYTTIHLSVSDPSGDNAIFEYVNGKLVINHSPDYTVMTNDPTFKEQLAISQYWKDIPGNTFLPGTVKSPDRFVRASYYINTVTQSSDYRVAVAAAFSVIRNVSVPYGIHIEGYPNLSTTRWRVVADQKNLVYYYEDVLSPNAVWVDLKKMDFKKGAGVKKLALDHHQIYAGETSKDFVKTEPFKFMGVAH